MRDKLQSNQYFLEYINQQKDRINNFQFKINQGQVPSERIPLVIEKIDSLNFQVLIAKYSWGSPVEELIPEYERLAANMPNVWNPKSGYIDMLWMVSIGIMLEIDNDIFSILNKLVEESELDDYLLKYLFNSRDCEVDTIEGNFLFETPYKYLSNVITEDKNTGQKNLKYELENERYECDENTSEHDIHKEERQLDYGYCNFESGALGQSLRLDDSSFKYTTYYPYDLVQ